MAKIKRVKYFTRNFSTYTIYGRVVRTAKIKLHENLSHEIFLTRKFRDLRYMIHVCGGVVWVELVITSLQLTSYCITEKFC